MDDRTSPPAPERGFLAPSSSGEPGARCIRCGRPTPPDVALCDEHNPAHIKGPSATQMHATILAGVVVSAVLLLVLLRGAVGQGGPFEAVFVEKAFAADGSGSVVFDVSNRGASSGIATCRVTRDGAPRPDDPTYRTERIEPGATARMTRVVPAPPVDTVAYDTERMSVICT